MAPRCSFGVRRSWGWSAAAAAMCDEVAALKELLEDAPDVPQGGRGRGAACLRMWRAFGDCLRMVRTAFMRRCAFLAVFHVSLEADEVAALQELLNYTQGRAPSHSRLHFARVFCSTSLTRRGECARAGNTALYIVI